MYKTDFAYDGPIFLVPLSPSYPSSPVITIMNYTSSNNTVIDKKNNIFILDDNEA